MRSYYRGVGDAIVNYEYPPSACFKVLCPSFSFSFNALYHVFFLYGLFISLTPILISQITKRSLQLLILTIMTTTAIFFCCPPSSSKWPFQHTEKCLWDIGIKSHGRQERSDCVKGKMEYAFVRRQSGYDADPSIRCLKY